MNLFSRAAIDLAARELSEQDGVLSRIVSHVGVLDARKREPEFVALCSIITNQQLSGKAAGTIFSRVKGLPELKHTFDAKNFSKISIERLRACGLSSAKADYLLGYADLLLSNPTYFQQVEQLSDDVAIDELIKLRGVGPWTAAIFLMSVQGRMNLFPQGDGTLERSIRTLYGVCAQNDSEDFERLVISWSPYRSIAAQYLWKWFDSKEVPIFQGQSNS